MKIATYNIWNHETFDLRKKQIIKEINMIDADIIGLQEVPTSFYEDDLISQTNYPYHVYRQYKGEQEGLAILSRYPLDKPSFLYELTDYSNACALHVTFKANDLSFSFMNVHLPSDAIKAQEDQIIAINKFIDAYKADVNHAILLGDFNCGIHSSVHGFLTGEQTINGYAPHTRWDEMSQAYSVLNNQPLLPTLDCINNPRWKGKNTFYLPSVMDRIYLMDNWVYKSLESVENFGTEVSDETGLCASDHYGVMAKMSFKE